MKPQKMTAYPSFAAWELDQSAANQRIISALSRLVKNAAPEFKRGVKWGQGCWTLEGVPKIYFHTEPDHVQFGFFAGSSLDDPEGLLQGSGQHVRHVKVFSTRGIPRAALSAFIEQLR